MSIQAEIHGRLKALLGDVDELTAMTSCGPSALAGCLLLRWLGVNLEERQLRVDPRGDDLEQVLSEFADQCRAAASLSASAPAATPRPGD